MIRTAAIIKPKQPPVTKLINAMNSVMSHLSYLLHARSMIAYSLFLPLSMYHEGLASLGITTSHICSAIRTPVEQLLAPVAIIKCFVTAH